MKDKIKSLRMIRQNLLQRADLSEYIELYRDMQPGYNVYWNGFGNPPTLTYRSDFEDMEFNRMRQSERYLIKGRFSGGNIGWIMSEDLEVFAGVYKKPLTKPSERQLMLLEMIESKGRINIQQIKEETKLLVKEITPALHRLQEAFLIYEDQNDGEWDRDWCKFSEIFPQINIDKYSRKDALKILLKRFAYRIVWFDLEMVKSYFKLSIKEIKPSVDELVSENILIENDGGFILASDIDELKKHKPKPINSVFAMHRNDFMVKAFEYELKEKYTHTYDDTLYYMLIDGDWHGVVAGKFRYTPEVTDVLLDLPEKEKWERKDSIINAIKTISGIAPEFYCGEEL